MLPILFILLFVVLFSYGVILVFVAPRWSIERQVVIEAIPERIFPYLNQIKRWNDWTGWNAVIDPSFQASYDGEEEGLGAIRKWTSEEQMNGILTIVQSNWNENIQYHLDLNDHYFILKGHIRLSSINASQTQITWLCYTESSGLNPFKRLQMAALKKLFIRHLQTNLVQLKMIAEQE